MGKVSSAVLLGLETGCGEVVRVFGTLKLGVKDCCCISVQKREKNAAEHRFKPMDVPWAMDSVAGERQVE
jgi:hypothetical protein